MSKVKVFYLLLCTVVVASASNIEAVECVKHPYGKMPVEVAKKRASNSHLRGLGVSALGQRVLGIRWVILGVMPFTSWYLPGGVIAGAVYAAQAEVQTTSFCNSVKDCSCTSTVGNWKDYYYKK